MQALCSMLILGWKDGFETKPSDVSPWFESKLDPIEEMVAQMEGIQHRRFIKTHTPLSGIPYDESNEYIVIYRDFRDVFFSMRSHVDNMTVKVCPELMGPASEAFRRWVQAPARDGDDNYLFTLEALVEHFESFGMFRDLSNFHFFHYADMSRDLSGVVRRLAGILGIDIDSEGIEEVSRVCHFENMREKADQFAPNPDMGLWKSNRRFFRKGQNGQWRDDLTADDLDLYEARLKKLLEESDVEWLYTGGDLPPISDA